MSIRVVVPELLKKARGVRSMDEIVRNAGGAFGKGIYSGWENGLQPKDKNKIALCRALGVKYEKISLPLDRVPADSKFFAQQVK